MAARFVILLALLPAVEYLMHRLLMHHSTPLAPAIYDRHAVQHHRRGRLDVNVDLPWWWVLMLICPVLIPLAWWSRPDAVIVAGVAVAYSLLWTGIHRAIHGIGGRWATRLPWYAALRRHHLAHHRRPARNYGTVFGPLLDWPLGTWERGGE